MPLAETTTVFIFKSCLFRVSLVGLLFSQRIQHHMFHESETSDCLMSLLLFPNVRSNIIRSRLVRSEAESEASDKKAKMSYFLQ